MSTSDRTVVAEAAGAVALVVGATALGSPHDVMLSGVGLHPIWLPIIVIAARYAARGLFLGLAFGWLGLLGADAALGGEPGSFAAHVHGSTDLLALTIAVLVTWIAMLHESRIARAGLRLAEACDAQQHAEANVHALHASLGHLRDRHDRLEMSISLWRSLSRRLEHGTPAEAARAALELCEVRAGARAGVIHACDGATLVALARRGQWSPTSAHPPDHASDATVRAAIDSRRVCPAAPGSSELDSDVAVPVLDGAGGAVIGVIALRGVSPGHMRAADLRDIGVIAQWLAPALATHLRSQAGRHHEDIRSGEVN